MRMVVGAGGTGGHIVPALAVADAVRRRIPVDVLFVGAGREVEERLVLKAGYGLEKVPVAGLPRGPSSKLFVFAFGLVKGLLRCRRIFLDFRPHLAFCTGGYAAFPVGVMAVLFRLPLHIHEPNRLPGLVNRLLFPWARKVYVGFAGVGPKGKEVCTGNPVRWEVGRISREEGRRRFGLGDGPVVFAFGGSQGARAINEALGRSLRRIVGEGAEVVWQTGEGDFEWASKTAEAYGGKVRVFAFVEDMAHILAAADLAVCRAGAMTVSELTASGLPAILVPLPSSAGGHQLRNARALEDAGAAVVLEEVELGRLAEEVVGLLKDEGRLRRMKRASRRLGRRDAAERIAEGISKELTQSSEHV